VVMLLLLGWSVVNRFGCLWYDDGVYCLQSVAGMAMHGLDWSGLSKGAARRTGIYRRIVRNGVWSVAILGSGLPRA
jgi:hypothetical protein